MRSYAHEAHFDVSPDVAWRALSEMEVWLPRLSTNNSVTAEAEPFFVQGRHYDVHTRENATMHATLTEIDEAHRTVVIDAHSGHLRSHLLCRVVDDPNGGCTAQRVQSYPGAIGHIFTFFMGRREESETQEYLKVWLRHAHEIVS